MTQHYYSRKPEVGSDEQTWTYELRGHALSFTSDRGVFSKKEVDFGSRLLIEHFQLPAEDGPILDVGCGYGPIGIALAKEFQLRNIFMVDINERAIELAKKNAENNKVNNVAIEQSDLFTNVKQRDFASILTNPPIRAGKKVVHQLFEDAYHYMLDGGELWVVIQKKQGAPSAIEKLESMFTIVEVVTKKKGYYIVKAIK
ncbi:class I SAM-dependent methyltransferase [Desertibacillus haloalkaliphilus]|uniref:class I SAM-dependent methyltransferase n=1 Tax=Desertibacillus haloalkaliphilus TaxID=1328930 RepID=UPI001C27820D|nr:class I SAM-dependent methyltransferase [Desertibacillus haloalkaliphilus]MBU8908627.1 class I SAM-dependent methyltransferase [Desertibacillus haloalkaliphilus]